jgi:hypothetical protein
MIDKLLKTKKARSALPTVLAILLAGCAAPNPQPFQEYAAAVKEAGDSLDQVLLENTTWSKDEFEQLQMTSTNTVRLQDSVLLDESAPFTVQFPGKQEPMFYKLQDARSTLLAMNDAAEKYVDLLVTLAGSELVSTNTFASMAKDTESDLNSIVSTLNVKVPSGNAIPLFSVASSEILQLVIENKREKALVRILNESQPSVEGYCQKCIQLLEILDESLITDYRVKAMALIDTFDHIAPAERATSPAARQALENLLQLNSDYLALENSMREAKGVYEKLPQGHQDLLKTAESQPTGLAGIEALYQQAQRVKSLYNELNSASSSDAKKG